MPGRPCALVVNFGDLITKIYQSQFMQARLPKLNRAIYLPHRLNVSIRATPWLQKRIYVAYHTLNMTHMAGIPDGATITYKGKTFIMDDVELVEIVCSFDDMKIVLKSL